MEIASYFHPNFLSLGANGKFVKVCIELGDGHQALGMFAVIINEKGKLQIQRYDYLAKGRIASNIFGKDKSRCVISVQNLISSWDTFSTDEKMNMTICVRELSRSLYGYIELVNLNNHSMNENDINDVFNFIINLHNTVEVLQNNGRINTADVFNNISQTEDNNSGTIQDVIDTPEKSVRNMIKMAKIKNATDLTEFVVGNFYKVVKVETFDGKEYITIKNDNGEERCLLMKRVEQVDVYDNAPANDLPIDNKIEEVVVP